MRPDVPSDGAGLPYCVSCIPGSVGPKLCPDTECLTDRDAVTRPVFLKKRGKRQSHGERYIMSEQEEVNAALKRFTPRANKALGLAQAEAERDNHDSISVEHLLFGICRLNEGIAVEVLRAMKVNLDHLTQEILRKLPQSGSEMRQIGAPPFSARLCRIIVMSGDEARAMRCNYIGSEHLLLAILRTAATCALARSTMSI